MALLNSYNSSMCWVLVLSILFLYLLPSLALNPGGVNVCSKQQRYTTYVKKSRSVYVKEQYRTKCFNWKWQTCSKYRIVARQQYYSEPQTRVRSVYQCCNGWKPSGNGQECTIAICSKYGCVNGICSKPDVCNCTEGYEGPSCSKACPLHKYGGHCRHDCKCQNNATCDSKDGTCDCLEGWTGTYCNNSCSAGSFGKNCSQRCDCVESNVMKQYCESKTGKCICKLGYTGARCEYPCTNSTYGADCSHKCECTEHGTCAIDTGYCNCSEGYTGKRCERTCTRGTTGYRCHDCECQNNATCDLKDGTCDCLEGWTGTYCNNSCSAGSFGKNCSQRCDCVESNVMKQYCESKTGKCICKLGYIGARCEYPCTNNTYGADCSFECVCTEHGTCAIDTGYCNCSEGYTGERCERTCSRGTAGDGCRTSCNCTTDQGKCNPISEECSCSPRTGECECKPGYNNGDCSEHQVPQDFPLVKKDSSSPALLIGVIVAVVAVTIFVVALLTVWVCRRRRHPASVGNTSKLNGGDNSPYVVPMEVTGVSNMPTSDEYVIPNEHTYSDVTVTSGNNERQNTDYGNVNYYEEVQAKTNHRGYGHEHAVPRTVREEDQQETYQELRREQHEESSFYQPLNKV